MTLDQCVQRLRKRMSEESQAAHAAALRNQTTVNATTGFSPVRLDRTPSFYTSKSLVNLSGLSVADPAPVHQVYYQQGVQGKNSRDNVQEINNQSKSPMSPHSRGKRSPNISLYGELTTLFPL